MQAKHIAALIGICAVAAPLLAGALPESAFEGAPALTPGSVTGAFVWQDADGLHLRVTSKGSPARFHGRVCTQGKIKSLGPVTLESGDTATVGPRGHCALFNLTNNGHVDGFDMQASGNKLVFEIKKGPHDLPPSSVWIGAKGLHPTSQPFVLER